MKQLDSPYIVKLLDVLKTRENLYLVMDFCEGGDLEKYIKHNGAVPEALGRKWLAQLFRAFLSLLETRVLHRDLKLANLLLTNPDPYQSDIKVADFGFARFLNEDALAVTQLGTPLYMAPEIFDGEQYDHKIDVWSLGVLAYELFTGMQAFLCRTIPELRRLQKEPIRFPANCPLSAECKDIITQMLTYRRDLRPSFEELTRHKFIAHEFDTAVEAQSSPDVEMSDAQAESEKESEIDEDSYDLMNDVAPVESPDKPASPQEQPQEKLPEITIPDDEKQESPYEKELVEVKDESQSEEIQQDLKDEEPQVRVETNYSSLAKKTLDLDMSVNKAEEFLDRGFEFLAQKNLQLGIALVKISKDRLEKCMTTAELLMSQFNLTRSRDILFTDLYEKIQLRIIQASCTLDEVFTSLHQEVANGGDPRILEISEKVLVEKAQECIRNSEVKLALELLSLACEWNPSNMHALEVYNEALNLFEDSIRVSMLH